MSCEYYTEGQVSNKLKNCNGLVVMHFIARSLQANFDKLELCVTQINATVAGYNLSGVAVQFATQFWANATQ